VHPLALWIRVGNLRPRLAEPETQCPKQPLTLSHPQLDAEFLVQVSGQDLSVPEIGRQTSLLRRTSQGASHLFQLLVGQPPRPTRPDPLLQARQSGTLEGTNPILDRTGGVSEHRRGLAATHSLGNQQNTVQAVVVACFLGPPDLVLESQNHHGSVGNGQWSHENMRPQFCSMRKYL